MGGRIDDFAVVEGNTDMCSWEWRRARMEDNEQTARPGSQCSTKKLSTIGGIAMRHRIVGDVGGDGEPITAS